jgi:hypothetical protein
MSPKGNLGWGLDSLQLRSSIMLDHRIRLVILLALTVGIDLGSKLEVSFVLER